MLIIHPAVDLYTGELLIASEIALNETLSNAPSMSRKVPKLPKTYPLLAILRSMVCAILCNAVSVEVPLLKPNCFLLRLSVML